MAMARAAIFAVLLSLAAGAKVSPVQKVIQLIDDMAGKVTKEMNAGTATFEEFAKFCDDEATEKGYAIKDSKEEIEELTATITDAKATIDTSDSTVGDLTTKISDVEGELATSVALRKKENEMFVKTEAEMV